MDAPFDAETIALPSRAAEGRRLEFDILIPIWGERYIRRFAELGLRTLLAPGNLPRLCREHHVKVTVLTSREGPAMCRWWPAFAALGRIAEIEFVEIDDLIAAYGSNYSVILTRAYNRGMALSGDPIGRNFMYLVGDQVFADGSLLEIARAMAAGSDACLACTARLEAEPAVPRLAALGGPESLSLQARDLVDLALEYPHPTRAAKTVRDGQIQLNAAHQFFWKPNPDTLVARCFLVHMLCIRPTRRPTDIAAFCDYAFVSELAPNGRYHFLDDSDAFVAIELQDANHETEFITPYPLSPPEIAQSVSAWAAAIHHACIDATFVFKGSGSEYSASAARALTQPYVDELRRNLAPPLDHRHHPFWLGAVGAELTLARDGADGRDLPLVLRELIAKHLDALAPESLDLAVAVEDRRSSLVRLLAGSARTAVRITADILCDGIEDVAGPGGTVLTVLLGNLRNFLELFSHRGRIARLLRIVGPGRSVLLCFRAEISDFVAHGISRSELYRLAVVRLPLFAQLGIPLRFHDLAPQPLVESSGFIVEIASDSAPPPRPASAWSSEPEEDPLFGLRGELHRTRRRSARDAVMLAVGR